MRRRIVLLIPLVALMLAVAFLLIRSGSTDVKIQINAPLEAKIIKAGELANDSLYGQPTVASFTSNYSAKLKKGSYVLLAEGGNDYEDISSQFEVGSKPINVSVSPSYSKEKLSVLLKEQEPIIETAIRDKYDRQYWLPPGYSYKLASGTLFQRGDWYGGLIVPAHEGEDTLRIIMKKTDGQWSVVTDPPDIILSSVIYPDVPKEILKSVNAL